jgi:hypothetical protein
MWGFFPLFFFPSLGCFARFILIAFWAFRNKESSNKTRFKKSREFFRSLQEKYLLTYATFFFFTPPPCQFSGNISEVLLNCLCTGFNAQKYDEPEPNAYGGGGRSQWEKMWFWFFFLCFVFCKSFSISTCFFCKKFLMSLFWLHCRETKNEGGGCRLKHDLKSTKGGRKKKMMKVT